MTYRQVWDHMNNQVHDGMIFREKDEAWIPFDEGNRDYREYMAWLEEGNQPKPPQGTPTPPIETEPPPDIVDVNAQVQELDQRLTDLENQVGATR